MEPTVINLFLEVFSLKKSNEALSIFNQNNKNNWPILFFDTGKRIIKNLEWLNTTIQCEQITIGKELTKTFETILAGTLEHVIETLSDQSLKGEWCYLLEKPSVKTSIQLTQLIEIGKEMNLSKKQIIQLSKYISKISKPKLKLLLDSSETRLI